MSVVRQSSLTATSLQASLTRVTRDAAELAAHANRTVADLRICLHEVDGMTRLIASVADQTKLLALNATIEAA